ncbi:MAG: nuclear transport factor 2 family protein, partial [Vicinamibacterales bacterium]
LPAPSAQVPVRTAAPARVDITATSRQWLDAYHRQDRVTMESLGAPSLTISDERLADQRFPFGLEIARAFEDEQLELSGDSAKFTAKMTERAATGAVVSRVAQTWVRRQGQWQLQEARIVHDSQSPTVPR